MSDQIQVPPPVRKPGMPKPAVVVDGIDPITEPDFHNVATDEAPGAVDLDNLAATDEYDIYATLVKDPFAQKDPLHFKKHPPGKHLSWLNPKLRASIGMRGFQYVSYDDPIGRELHLYLSDPPTKMEGSANLDNLVRRGDSVLGWIPWGIWQARQNARREKGNRLSPEMLAPQLTYGSGVTDDDNPRQLGEAQERGTHRTGKPMPRDGIN